RRPPNDERKVHARRFLEPGEDAPENGIALRSRGEDPRSRRHGPSRRRGEPRRSRARPHRGDDSVDDPIRARRPERPRPRAVTGEAHLPRLGSAGRGRERARPEVPLHAPNDGWFWAGFGPARQHSGHEKPRDGKEHEEGHGRGWVSGNGLPGYGFPRHGMPGGSPAAEPLRM